MASTTAPTVNTTATVPRDWLAPRPARASVIPIRPPTAHPARLTGLCVKETSRAHATASTTATITAASTWLSPPAAGGAPYTFTKGR